MSDPQAKAAELDEETAKKLGEAFASEPASATASEGEVSDASAARVEPDSPPTLQEEDGPTAIGTPEDEERAIDDALARVGGTPSNPRAGDEPEAKKPRFDREATRADLEKTQYAAMRKASGKPLFSESELKLIASDTASLAPKKKGERDSLIKRASAWRKSE